jgi:nitroreductase
MSVELNKGLPIEALNDVSSTLKVLETRRSASAKSMTGPGPSPRQLERILNIAARVPDHGKLVPWRFVVFEGEARRKAGQIVATCYQELHPSHGEETLEVQRTMFSRAPCVVGVISSTVKDHPKIPEWEQILSAGAVCQNILIAATAMQIGAQWISGWFAYDRPVLAQFGLAEHERIAGFIYLGRPVDWQGDRPRPEAASITTRF